MAKPSRWWGVRHVRWAWFWLFNWEIREDRTPHRIAKEIWDGTDMSPAEFEGKLYKAVRSAGWFLPTTEKEVEQEEERHGDEA